MATSPIYNWPEPDNTDLVKNGALAIRTLGNAIDTTMATMTPKSIVDAKGDIIAATANDTPARLAVGTDYNVLSAQSGETTGLLWAGAPTTFTPTWTAVGTAPSIGNGTMTMTHQRYGKMCFVRFFFKAGSTTTFGTGAWFFSLPFTAANNSLLTMVGNAYAEDAVVAAYALFIRIQSNGTTITLPHVASTLTTDASSTFPFAWANNDYLQGTFVYEVA